MIKDLLGVAASIIISGAEKQHAIGLAHQAALS
jgi:hypothetical protein